jgi:hypothetical protein
MRGVGQPHVGRSDDDPVHVGHVTNPMAPDVFVILPTPRGRPRAEQRDLRIVSPSRVTRIEPQHNLQRQARRTARTLRFVQHPRLAERLEVRRARQTMDLEARRCLPLRWLPPCLLAISSP